MTSVGFYIVVIKVNRKMKAMYGFVQHFPCQIAFGFCSGIWGVAKVKTNRLIFKDYCTSLFKMTILSKNEAACSLHRAILLKGVSHLIPPTD